MKRAVVLGAGPAGLFAAHALWRDGWEVDIFGKGARKSHMWGAQYLHRPIPGLSTSPAVTVNYVLRGTPEGYRQKVYGTTAVPSVSVEDLPVNHKAWDIREAYNAAWELYGSRVHAATFDYASMVECCLFDKFDLVVSSIPANAICKDPSLHGFTSQKVWGAGDAPDRGQVLDFQCLPNTVICDGTADVGWYRLSNLFGHKTVEYGGDLQWWMPGVLAEIVKPISNECDCWPRLVRVGRYGTYTKGVLSDSAFYDLEGLL